MPVNHDVSSPDKTAKVQVLVQMHKTKVTAQALLEAMEKEVGVPFDQARKERSARQRHLHPLY
jgi:hypothetical protein